MDHWLKKDQTRFFKPVINVSVFNVYLRMRVKRGKDWDFMWNHDIDLSSDQPIFGSVIAFTDIYGSKEGDKKVDIPLIPGLAVVKWDNNVIKTYPIGYKGKYCLCCQNSIKNGFWTFSSSSVVVFSVICYSFYFSVFRDLFYWMNVLKYFMLSLYLLCLHPMDLGMFSHVFSIIFLCFKLKIS